MKNFVQHFLQLYWRDIRTKGAAQYYISIAPGNTLSVNTYENHEWTVKDTNGRSLIMNNKQKLVQKSNKESDRAIYLIKRPGQTQTGLGDKYIELMVVVDKAAVDVHADEEEVKRYIVANLRLATQILQHNDITQHGLKFHLVLSKLVLLDRELPEVKLNPDLREKNLIKVCNYMNKIGKSGKFDHKLFITKNVFGMGGFAHSNTMCNQHNSCSMVFDHGFTAAFLIAHELSHSLGADDKNFGQNSGYVMSAMVDARFDFHSWSKYSQVSFLENIRHKTCLNNRPTKQPGLPFVHKYPGVHFPLTKQCQVEYDEGYKVRTSNDKSYDPCKHLTCRMPPPYSFLAKTTKSPALDGTDCGKNKWCMSGQCIFKGNSGQGPKPVARPTQPVKVDGRWKDWAPWSSCSRTCNTGVQTRTRRCTMPRNGGKPCFGVAGQVRKCQSGKTCRGSQNDAMCAIAGRRTDSRRQWKYYDQEITGNLDCTFESGTCKWTTLTKRGYVQWQRHKGQTPSSQTGPSADHTLKTARGYYMYLESSANRARAQLTSPNIKVRQGCLRFWYHMYGDSQMGVLKVLLVTGGVSKTLWKKTGNRGNRWYYQTLNVRSSTTYKLSLMAKEKGIGYKSDIAIDDITFTPGACSNQRITSIKASENPCKISCKTSDTRSPPKILSSVNVYDGIKCSTKTTNGVCYQGTCKSVGCDDILTNDEKKNCDISQGRKQIGTVVKQVSTRTTSNLNCDFDRNFCHWRNLKSNSLNWLRVRQTGKGYILQVKRSSRRGGIKTASIVSPEVAKNPSATSSCLTFSYYLSRRGGYARFQVKTLVSYPGNPDYVRSRKYMAATSERWNSVKMELRSTRSYKIVFEVLVPSAYTGYVGIDNVRFNEGKCQMSKG